MPMLQESAALGVAVSLPQPTPSIHTRPFFAATHASPTKQQQKQQHLSNTVTVMKPQQQQWWRQPPSAVALQQMHTTSQQHKKKKKRAPRTTSEKANILHVLDVNYQDTNVTVLETAGFNGNKLQYLGGDRVVYLVLLKRENAIMLTKMNTIM
eukprot:scaffold4175_cov81-Skeletonema_marinoi.AAC.1